MRGRTGGLPTSFPFPIAVPAAILPEQAPNAGQLRLATGLVADCNGTQGNGTDNAAAFSALAGYNVVPPGIYRVGAGMVQALGATFEWMPGARPVFDDGVAPTLNGKMIWPHILPWGVRPETWGQIGDSRASNTELTNSTTARKKPENPLYGLELASGGWYEHSVYHNQAVSGTTTYALDGQIALLLAVTPACDRCLILSGVNDSPGTTTAQQVSNMLNAWFRLRAGCVDPFHLADPPQSVAASTDQVRKRRYSTNRTLAQFARKLGVPFVDVSSVLVDPTSSTSDVVSANYADGIHPNYVGGPKVSARLYQHVSQYIPAGWLGRDFPQQAYDVYDANGSNPNLSGNLLTNPFWNFNPSGGSTSPAGALASGTVPSGWNLLRVSGATGALALSVVARTDKDGAGNWLVIVPSSTDASLLRLKQTQLLTSRGLVTGDRLATSFDVDISGAVNAYLEVFVLAQSGATLWQGIWQHEGTAGTVAALAGRVIMPPVIVSSGNDSIELRFELTLANAAAGTFKIGNPAIRKVTV